jgi:hypothetical protein
MIMRCRLGDIVIILSSDFSENIGKTGEIVGVGDYGEFIWEVNPAHGVFCGWSGNGNGRPVMTAAGIYFEDKALLPIRPGEEDKTTREPAKESA